MYFQAYFFSILAVVYVMQIVTADDGEFFPKSSGMVTVTLDQYLNNITTKFPQSTVYVKDENILISPVFEIEKEMEPGKLDFDKIHTKRYEVKIHGVESIKNKKIPITTCHDSRNGFGGYKNVAASVAFKGGMSASVSLNIPVYDFLTGGLGIKISNSISSTESITCDVKAGDVGQIFIEPWSVKVTHSHRIYSENKLAPGKKTYLTEWSPRQQSEWPVQISPAPYCHTGEENVQCDLIPHTILELPTVEIIDGEAL
ncbi:hypothetical protein PACTADRAFT_34573 [Pachysolen tannophilus NRRL Y-2460]|uniref:Uncharacterized protein n=1 Tax=Pachysolen tannophilus NRRL Y-2460 TaxID=669874 RepID=A0A1E4TSU2_PACTA|nr:hypothetical protein PACTADRAFT_34573 [Pachysolen tannophilus NRRL Y-2460]